MDDDFEKAFTDAVAEVGGNEPPAAPPAPPSGNEPPAAPPAPPSGNEPPATPLAPPSGNEPTHVAAPPGWSVAAKLEFDKLPTTVKEAVANREAEINQGFSKLSNFKNIEPFMEMAQRDGVDLGEFIQNTVAANQLLESDFVGGIAQLCNNYGVDPRQLAQIFLGDNSENNPLPNGVDPALMQRFNALEQSINGLSSQREMQEQQQAANQISQFASNPANKFFENVKSDMSLLIQNGKAQGLEDAYEQACWLNPDIRAHLINEEAAKTLTQKQSLNNQRRQAASGLPINPPPSNYSNGNFDTLDSALADAFASQGSSI